MRRGTTLLELMVACALFVSIMTAIISFYVYASHVTRRQQAISEGYRAAVERLDRLETLLEKSRVYQVQSDRVVFQRMGEVPTVARRWSRFAPDGGVLRVEGGRVVLNKQRVDYTMFILRPDEKIEFSTTGRVLKIKITGSLRAEGHAPFDLERSIILENPPPI